mgnify:CR=1 FL=1
MKIIGTGSALPRKVVTNDMLAGFLDTSDEWIYPRTGIKTRHVITDENLEDLGTEGHSGRFLDACDDRVLDFPGLVVCLRHVKRIDESRTRAVDVEHRTFKPQFLSDDAAHPRGDIFGNNIGDGTGPGLSF